MSKFKKIVYDNEIKRLIEKHSENFSYPLEVDKIKFDDLELFNQKYFNQYKECLLKNAAIYAIKTNDTKYIKLFNNKNIKELIKEDILVRAIISRNAIYNIIYKQNKNINIDIETINNNKELFNKLMPTSKIDNINNIYRNIIMDYLSKFDDKKNEYILEQILITNNYDNDLLDNYKDINDIKLFKYILLKIILSDTYLYLKSLEYEELLDEEINNIKNEFYNEDNELIEGLLDKIDTEIINFIENLNKIKLPNSNRLRYNLYNKFIIYNKFINSHNYDLDNIKENEESIKTLKKINPIYFLDYIKD